MSLCLCLGICSLRAVFRISNASRKAKAEDLNNNYDSHIFLLQLGRCTSQMHMPGGFQMIGKQVYGPLFLRIFDGSIRNYSLNGKCVQVIFNIRVSERCGKGCR